MPAISNRFLVDAGVRAARDVALIFGVVLVASLFGILTRPVGFLAAIWPANAILLGLMVRNSSLSSVRGWCAAFAGYVAADLLTGSGFVVTLWLTLANMSGVAAGYLLFSRLIIDDRRLRRPISIVYLFSICTLAAGVAAVAGGGAANMLFSRDLLTGFAFWFTTELVNMIVFLPVLLAFPSNSAWTLLKVPTTTRGWLPALTLAASLAGSLIIGGPGAFAYPIPALLWCALSYNLFGTTILTLGFSIVQLVAIGTGQIPFAPHSDTLMTSVSIRLAIALIVLGPLAVASINAAREETLRRLQYMANHDSLTGALVRGVFMSRGEELLSAAGGQRLGTAVLMVDIDHFKSINDRYGHAAGDRVLMDVSRAIGAVLRKDDLFGRLGGEEFGIILDGTDGAQAPMVAERIRNAVEALVLDVDGFTVRVTVSIGLAEMQGSQEPQLATLLSRADRALYEAKAGGRNRVVSARDTRSTSLPRNAA